MSRSRHVRVDINLSTIRQNTISLSKHLGVPLIAVVKADAYGLGMKQVARAIVDLVSSFYVFDLAEVIEGDLASTGRPTIVLRSESLEHADYQKHLTRPVVWTREAAAALRSNDPVLSIDTGQQRFGIPVNHGDEIDAILAAGGISEAFTHATRLEQALALSDALRGKVKVLHAAASALLDEPRALLDAVRPGLALYRGAAKVSAKLIEVRDTKGPAGYTGFKAERHGVFLAGYSNGLRAGAPCLVAGQPSRVIEVGMQSAFVECPPKARVGDEVVLLGDGITESAVATAWGTSPQEALVRLTGMGERVWTE